MDPLYRFQAQNVLRPHLAPHLSAVLRMAIAPGLLFGAMARPVVAQNAPVAGTPDDEWAAIAQRVPGFAGWWYAGNTGVLMLVDTTRREAAVGEIASELRRRHIRTVRVQKADFDFIHLRRWKLLVPFDTVSRVTSVDADEARNRIVVSVADSAYLAPTRKRLLALGIPTKALVLEVAPYAVPQ